jgi:hypothetical protein
MVTMRGHDEFYSLNLYRVFHRVHLIVPFVFIVTIVTHAVGA